MLKINQNFADMAQNYLFAEIANRVNRYQAENPDKNIIRLGIGDVTRPLPQACVQAMKKAADEMGKAETFRGYGPDYGYDFLLQAIAKHDFQDHGISISADEIFLSDGAKSDTSSIGDIFAVDNVVAVCDPVYPGMWIPTSWQAAPVRTKKAMDLKRSSICLAGKKTGFCPSSPKKR